VKEKNNDLFVFSSEIVQIIEQISSQKQLMWMTDDNECSG